MNGNSIRKKCVTISVLGIDNEKLYYLCAHFYGNDVTLERMAAHGYAMWRSSKGNHLSKNGGINVFVVLTVVNCALRESAVQSKKGIACM